MNQPLVSICFVTYNHVNFVAEALNSILIQNYQNLEIVIADDGSKDGTYDIVSDYSKKHPDKINLLPNRINQGLNGIKSNYNRALQACKGKYIAFLEGDDAYLPGKIKKQVEWMEEDERRVLCGHEIEIFDSDTNNILFLKSARYPARKGIGAKNLIHYGVPFGTVATMVRASVIPSYGYDEHLNIVLDWKLWIDCLTSGGIYGYVDGTLARYRRHSKSITAMSSTNNQMHQMSIADRLITLSILESNYPHLLKDCIYGRARLFYSEGIYCLQNDKIDNARAYLLNSLKLFFFVSWKVPFWLLITFMPQKILKKILKSIK
ncbi:glycosyltransferase [Candidatus Poribacteria bacterium]|nr:glycosyltransferase [Candidatus Poribacteria bacterium]